MILTGAFFADAASMADGKLYVLGGGWDTIEVPLVEGVNTRFVLVTMVQLNPGDHGRGSVRFRLINPDGVEVATLDGQVSTDRHREQASLITALDIHFPRAGRHVVLVEGDADSAISLPLNVVPARR